MIKLQFRGRFDSEYRELITTQPDIKETVLKRINWFRKNPDDTRLDNHSLTGRLEGKWAFSVTQDIRIVYEWIGKTAVRFLRIGSHDLVYRKS